MWLVKLVFLIAFLSKEQNKFKSPKDEENYSFGLTIFEQGFNFFNHTLLKPQFIMSTIFVLEDILWRLEVYADESYLLDESYGIDTSNYISSTPNWLSIFESKD